MSFIETIGGYISRSFPDISIENQGNAIRGIYGGNVMFIISDDTWLTPKVTISYDIDKQEQIHYGNIDEHAEARILEIIRDSINYGKFLHPLGLTDQIRWANTKEKIQSILKDFKKEFHLFLDLDDAGWDGDCDVYYYDHGNRTCSVATTVLGTRAAIENGQDMIATTQVALLSFDLMASGYRLFVHRKGKMIEFMPYMDHKGLKEIRYGHNLCKLILSGYFDADFE